MLSMLRAPTQLTSTCLSQESLAQFQLTGENKHSILVYPESARFLIRSDKMTTTINTEKDDFTRKTYHHHHHHQVGDCVFWPIWWEFNLARWGGLVGSGRHRWAKWTYSIETEAHFMMTPARKRSLFLSRKLITMLIIIKRALFLTANPMPQTACGCLSAKISPPVRRLTRIGSHVNWVAFSFPRSSIMFSALLLLLLFLFPLLIAPTALMAAGGWLICWSTQRLKFYDWAILIFESLTKKL